MLQPKDEKTYFFHNDAEVTAFEYDEEEKIISSKKFILSVPEHIMEKYYYRYQNGLLEAKETGQFASESQERQVLSSTFMTQQAEWSYKKCLILISGSSRLVKPNTTIINPGRQVIKTLNSNRWLVLKWVIALAEN